MYRSEIIFNKGAILRKEMLEDMYEYPRMVVESFYGTYSDGILYGLDWIDCEETPGHPLIAPGALKYHGCIYFAPEQVDVEKAIRGMVKDGFKYRLCFVPKEVRKPIAARSVYELELRAMQSEEYEKLKNTLFYYSRVKYVEGKGLITLNDDDTLYGLYAANDGYGYRLPCTAVKRYIPELERKGNKHYLDYMLLQAYYEGKGISVSFARMYIEACGETCEQNDFSHPVVVLHKLAESMKKIWDMQGAISQEKLKTEQREEDSRDQGGLLT